MHSVTSNAVAEAIGKVISQDLNFTITTGTQYNYSNYYTVPKGTYIAIAHFDHGSYNIDLMYGIDGSAILAPSRNAIINNGLNGGFVTVNAVLQSDGTKQIRGYVYPYGTVSATNCAFILTLIKVAS